MYVVVVGMGQVGRHLVALLEVEGHDVVAVDQDPRIIADVEEHHDILTLVGFGANERVLYQAGAPRANLVVSVTDNDEVNLIAALTARKLGAKRVVARVQGPAWSDETEGVVYHKLGVDVVINPRLLVAQEVAKIARSHGALEVIDMANDLVELVQVQLNAGCRLLRKPLAKLDLPPNTLVAAIVRNGELSVPSGADVLLQDDRIYLLGRRENVIEAEDLFTTKREAESACIVGGGVIGNTLATSLVADGARVLLIEKDDDRARFVAEQQPKITVLNADGTNLALLHDERIGEYDMFVATSKDDETNLMACLLAKRLGSPRSVAVVHRPDYMEIYRHLGVDIVLSPRVVASDHILRYTRAEEIRRLTVLEGGQAEVLEIAVPEGSRGIGVPLKNLGMPRGSIVGALVNSDGVTIPHGDDLIEAGDTVIVLTTSSARPSVGRLFQKRAL